MKKKEILFSIVFTLVALLLFYVFKPTERKICMKAYSATIKMQYIGIVKDKFIDNRNHLAPTIIVDSGHDSITITDFRDESGLFEYLEKGDSIKKIDNSPIVLVKRNGTNLSFTITYNCPD
jgi:hypothetical protein